MEKFVVTVVDTGFDSNFVPHCEGVFATLEEAKDFVHADINGLIADAQADNMEYDVDFDKMVFQTLDENYGSVWNIEKIKI